VGETNFVGKKKKRKKKNTVFKQIINCMVLTRTKDDVCHTKLV